MTECDILGVKTYSDPSFVFSGVNAPTPRSMLLAAASRTIFVHSSLLPATPIASCAENPVHDETLSIQFISGLSRSLDPVFVPSLASSPRRVEFVTLCPKCCDFLCVVVPFAKDFFHDRRPKIETEDRQQGVGVVFLGGSTKPPPHQLQDLGSAVSSPAGFGAEPRPSKGFPLFQHSGWPLLTL